ncbi:MAG: PAS domain S-box protein [Candidatus Pacebacteria bacterium]|jgi:PAS domain S-box-containing protein|nr:PAS domain S-box protein [Candidatus Paceibacterota bacterium]
MEPLEKYQNLTRVGAPKNAILERAEEVADSHLPTQWKIFPYAVFLLLLSGLFSSWKFITSEYGINAFSLPVVVLLSFGAIFAVFILYLLVVLIRSYLFVLRTSKTLFFQDQMFSLVLEGGKDAIWDWDMEKNKIYFSPQWNDMFGYRKTGMSDNPADWLAIVHPDDVASFQQDLTLHLEKRNATFHSEHRVRTVSGDYKWVLDHGHAVWDKDGKVLRLAGSTSDISNVKEVEAVLQGKTEELERANDIVKQEKVKYEALLTSIGDGMIAVNQDGQIMVMNPQAGKMLGRNASWALGRFITEVVSLEQNDKEEPLALGDRPVMKTLVQGIRIETVSYLFSADGTKFPASVTSAPIFLEERLIGAIIVFRDITHEKEVDKSKTEFVSLASHQLRTPLSAIRWYSEMLNSEKLGPLNEQQKSYMQEIYDSNRHMIELVNSLLNVSRIDLGTFAIEPSPTDFREIAESVLKELFVKIQESEMHVSTSYEEGIPKINADPKLIRIIFQNLLSNAVKYTKKGGQVSLSLTKDETSIFIKVSDTGVGIPASVQDKMFTKLFRADNARIVESEGTGLGLYIVKAVVEKGGGKIWFDSVENKGTTFYVTMPLSGMTALSGAKDLA